MKIDSVITLDNNENYLLLQKETLENDQYYLSVKLDENEEPTEIYAIFKESIENDGTYVEKIEDVNILTKLVDIFAVSLDKLINEANKF